jgi:hypothetical protein
MQLHPITTSSLEWKDVVSITQEIECVSRQVWKAKKLAPPEFDPRDVRKMRRYDYREGICKIHVAEVSVLLGMTPGQRVTRFRRSPTTC